MKGWRISSTQTQWNTSVPSKILESYHFQQHGCTWRYSVQSNQKRRQRSSLHVLTHVGAEKFNLLKVKIYQWSPQPSWRRGHQGLAIGTQKVTGEEYILVFHSKAGRWYLTIWSCWFPSSYQGGYWMFTHWRYQTYTWSQAWETPWFYPYSRYTNKYHNVPMHP